LFKISEIAFQFEFECPATTKEEGEATTIRVMKIHVYI